MNETRTMVALSPPHPPMARISSVRPRGGNRSVTYSGLRNRGWWQLSANLVHPKKPRISATTGLHSASCGKSREFLSENAISQTKCRKAVGAVGFATPDSLSPRFSLGLPRMERFHFVGARIGPLTVVFPAQPVLGPTFTLGYADAPLVYSARPPAHRSGGGLEGRRNKVVANADKPH